MQLDIARAFGVKHFRPFCVPWSSFVVCLCALMVVSNTASPGIVADTQTTVQDGKQPDTETLVKPKIDEWGYRKLVLPNGLEALLVSDGKADMAAAAMDVRFSQLNFARSFLAISSA